MLDFMPLSLQTGLLLDLSDSPFPTQVSGWNHESLTLPDNATHYGMVTSGRIQLMDEDSFYDLRAGMFFVLPKGGTIKGEGSLGLVISRLNYQGLWQLGGPLEPRGRLRYIDGCSDTLLVCPPRLGEPCLNHLHLPAHTSQSSHTHPSERIGVILRGRGECRTPEGVFPLEGGMAWRIPTGCLHSFFTEAESLDVIAWHPDSDFGPTDANHPMINRTCLLEERNIYG